jgi:DNA-binding response OmpR family regulator
MLLADRLRGDGYDVLAAATQDRVIEALEQAPPDLSIIGPAIAGPDEAMVAGWIRARVSTPILELRATPESDRSRRDARRPAMVDRTLTIPFSHEELLAAIDELLAPPTAAGPSSAPHLVLDEEEGVVRIGGRTVRLSPLEARLVAALLAEPGVSVTTARLLAEVWPDDRNPEPSSMWILVWRVRQKIEADPRRPRLLVSVPGSGYRLEVGPG